MLRMADMRAPHRWYPAARAIAPRRLIMHVGPTNSGKTYRALERLKEAASGVYLAPLRLLAWEVSERLSDGGVPCNLLTGQEREEREGARHVSCTVEMADPSSAIDVAVIDEAQMLGDADRGWAWTRALLSAPAPEVHLCGDASSVELVRRIAAITGDTVEVHEYERLAPLGAAGECLEGVADVRAGDCVVAFSRATLYSLKESIEAATGLRCGVVYGALPPSVRRQQAAAFNDPDGTVDVLVATDAVGMGLNLAIRRVVFSATDKFDGKRRRPLTISELKQIGGRAGRYTGAHAGAGEVTCLPGGDLSRVAAALGGSVPGLDAAGLLPATEQLEVFAAALLPVSQRRVALERIRRRHVASLARAAAAVGDMAGSLDELFEDESSDDEGDATSEAGRRQAGAGPESAARYDAEPASEAEEAEAEADEDAVAELERAAPEGKAFDSLFSFDPDDEDEGRSDAEGTGGEESDENEGRGRLPAPNSADEMFGPGVDATGRWGGAARPRVSRAADGLDLATRQVDGWIEAAAAAGVGGVEPVPGAPGAEDPHSDGEADGWEDASARDVPFSRLLELFARHSTVDEDSFFVCDQESVINLARAIDDVHPLALRDRHTLCCAPLEASSPLARHAFVRWARSLAKHRPVRVGLRVPSHTPVTSTELRAVEDAHKVFDAYLWLARRWPARFTDAEDCESRLEQTESMVADGLERLGMRGAAEARRRAALEQRAMRDRIEAAEPSPAARLAKAAKRADLSDTRDGLGAMVQSELERLRAQNEAILSRGGIRVRGGLGRLKAESKALARLTRRLARGKELSRKEQRAAVLLLEGSATEAAAEDLGLSREAATPSRRRRR